MENGAEYRFLVRTARSWGVPLSVFLGQGHSAPIVTGERVTGYVTLPGWSAEDRKAALDLAEWESALCSGCGGCLTETTAPENEGNYTTQAVRCHRCTASAMEAEKYRENPHPDALMIRTDLRES